MLRTHITEEEKGLLYKNERLIDVLGVGTYTLFRLGGNYRLERIRTDEAGIGGDKARRLVRLFKEVVERHFHIVALEDDERAFVTVEGKITDVLLPAETKLYFKELPIEVERVNIRREYTLNETHMGYVDKLAAVRGIKKHTVAPYKEAHLYVDGRYVRTLPQGKHYFFTHLRDIEIQEADTRLQTLDIHGQEVLSADKVTLRCNLTMHYRIVDAMRFLNGMDDAYDFLYKQLQFAARKHLGKHDIDTLLATQHTLHDAVTHELQAVCAQAGVEVQSVHIKDLILPGEMREIFNSVIEAAKKAEANNIKRREETAATRSLLNTAKLMKDNPALARLKELEALEKITQTVGTLNVYGGLEHVMHGLVKLTPDER